MTTISESFSIIDQERPLKPQFEWRNFYKHPVFVNAIELFPDLYFGTYGHAQVVANGLEIYDSEFGGLEHYRKFAIPSPSITLQQDEVLEIYAWMETDDLIIGRLGFTGHIDKERVDITANSTPRDPGDRLRAAQTVELFASETRGEQGHTIPYVKLIDTRGHRRIILQLTSEAIGAPHEYSRDILSIPNIAEIIGRWQIDFTLGAYGASPYNSPYPRGRSWSIRRASFQANTRYNGTAVHPNNVPPSGAITNTVIFDMQNRPSGVDNHEAEIRITDGQWATHQLYRRFADKEKTYTTTYHSNPRGAHPPVPSHLTDRLNWNGSSYNKITVNELFGGLEITLEPTLQVYYDVADEANPAGGWRPLGNPDTPTEPTYTKSLEFPERYLRIRWRVSFQWVATEIEQTTTASLYFFELFQDFRGLARHYGYRAADITALPEAAPPPDAVQIADLIGLEPKLDVRDDAIAAAATAALSLELKNADEWRNYTPVFSVNGKDVKTRSQIISSEYTGNDQHIVATIPATQTDLRAKLSVLNHIICGATAILTD